MARDQEEPNESFEKIYDRNSSDEEGVRQGQDDIQFNRGFPNVHPDANQMDGVDDIDEIAAQMAADESIYSHRTSTILDEEKVSFVHIPGNLPGEENQSEDDEYEQDMVYYNKDDLTNYSKHLGLNKVAKRKPNVPYYSENDIQEQEGDSEDNMETTRSADRHDYLRRKKREQELNNDDIEGRVKVDSWNLNALKRRKKRKKKKIDSNMRKRMDELQNIYGVDARTLAGLDQMQALKASGGKGGKGGPESRQSDMSFRSTQNTMRGTAQRFMSDRSSNMPMTGMSRRWHDIESALKGETASSNERKNRFGGVGPKKFPLSTQKKLTDTQQKFGGSGGFPEEESKHGSSRHGSNRRGGKKKAVKAAKKGYASG